MRLRSVLLLSLVIMLVSGLATLVMVVGRQGLSGETSRVEPPNAVNAKQESAPRSHGAEPEKSLPAVATRWPQRSVTPLAVAPPEIAMDSAGDEGSPPPVVVADLEPPEERLARLRRGDGLANAHADDRLERARGEPHRFDGEETLAREAIAGPGRGDPALDPPDVTEEPELWVDIERRSSDF